MNVHANRRTMAGHLPSTDSVVRVVRIAVVHSALSIDFRVDVSCLRMCEDRLLLQLGLGDSALNQIVSLSFGPIQSQTYLAGFRPSTAALGLGFPKRGKIPIANNVWVILNVCLDTRLLRSSARHG